ncbi:MAG: CpaF family protein [bacterium]|nr:CpaF family protein [bacterium]
MSLLERLEEAKQFATGEKPAAKTLTGHLQQLKLKVHDKLVSELDSKALEDKAGNIKKDLLKEQVEEFILLISSQERITLTRGEHDRLLEEILDEVLGLGPIEPLLKDPSVSEIMVNGPHQVYIERQGKIERTNITFNDNAHLLHIIDRIVSPIGRRVDESVPYVDARLKDGSRVNVVIPPLSLKGPALTIRKFFKERLGADDLIRFGTLTSNMAEFLKACVQARLNIIVSGGTGSGKTTTLNVLSSFISPNERIVTIEDTAELQLQQGHVLTLETRPPNIEGKGEISTRDLVRNALRMRPDRIIVGEVRGGEALDMLQAMNTGHDGSLTTIHSNSPRDTLSRVETMTLMAGMELPIKAIREQIASAINLIVHQQRLQDGSRRIVNITEVQGMERDIIVLQDVFYFEQKTIDEKGKVIGELKPTGIKPKFYSLFEERGIKLSSGIFVVMGRE